MCQKEYVRLRCERYFCFRELSTIICTYDSNEYEILMLVMLLEIRLPKPRTASRSFLSHSAGSQQASSHTSLRLRLGGRAQPSRQRSASKFARNTLRALEFIPHAICGAKKTREALSRLPASARLFLDVFAGFHAAVTTAIAALGLDHFQPFDLGADSAFDILRDPTFELLLQICWSGLAESTADSVPCDLRQLAYAAAKQETFLASVVAAAPQAEAEHAAQP